MNDEILKKLEIEVEVLKEVLQNVKGEDPILCCSIIEGMMTGREQFLQNLKEGLKNE